MKQNVTCLMQTKEVGPEIKSKESIRKESIKGKTTEFVLKRRC